MHIPTAMQIKRLYAACGSWRAAAQRLGLRSDADAMKLYWLSTRSVGKVSAEYETTIRARLLTHLKKRKERTKRYRPSLPIEYRERVEEIRRIHGIEFRDIVNAGLNYYTPVQGEFDE